MQVWTCVSLKSVLKFDWLAYLNIQTDGDEDKGERQCKLPVHIGCPKKTDTTEIISLIVRKLLFNARDYTCGNLMKLYFVLEIGF